MPQCKLFYFLKESMSGMAILSLLSPIRVKVAEMDAHSNKRFVLDQLAKKRYQRGLYPLPTLQADR